MTLEREKAQARGLAAEWTAAALLACKGYRILARRFRVQGGELDIVALTPPWTRPTMVFVEVRARSTIAEAVESVGVVKRRRVEAAAAQFCARRPKLGPLPRRFDLVLLARGRWPNHVVDAWRP